MLSLLRSTLVACSLTVLRPCLAVVSGKSCKIDSESDTGFGIWDQRMGDDGLPEEMVATFHNFHESLQQIETVLDPYLETPLDEMYDMLSPIEQAKSELITAYTVNSLYWSFLTTQGVKLEGHPLKKEMERIQMYMRKVKLLESALKGERPPTGHNPPTHQTVDKFAAARFIKRGIGKEKNMTEKESDKTI